MSFARVYARFERKKENVPASFKTIHAPAAFLLARIDDSPLATVSLIVNSDASPPRRARRGLHRAARRLQKYASAAAVVTYRLNEGKHSRRSVISIIAPRKRNRTRKIFIFCTAVNDESNRGNARPETSVSSGAFWSDGRRRRPPCGIHQSADASLISIAFKR